MATVEKVMMKTFFLLLTMSCAFQSFATLRTVEVASPSPYADTEWTTNVPFRIMRPASVRRFEMRKRDQHVCPHASFGVAGGASASSVFLIRGAKGV